ncbi:MAG: hypothetical protein HUK40_08175 [Desulfobacter sp.]|nr:hypothetical protein [Desulfobacter sp.]WDP84102.1 MAG: hypothetical protein HUN05_02105 [Desulfobacter sp.]
MLLRFRTLIHKRAYFVPLLWILPFLVTFIAQGCSVKSNMMHHLSKSILNNYAQNAMCQANDHACGLMDYGQ